MENVMKWNCSQYILKIVWTTPFTCKVHNVIGLNGIQIHDTLQCWGNDDEIAVFVVDCCCCKQQHSNERERGTHSSELSNRAQACIFWLLLCSSSSSKTFFSHYRTHQHSDIHRHLLRMESLWRLRLSLMWERIEIEMQAMPKHKI